MTVPERRLAPSSPRRSFSGPDTGGDGGSGLRELVRDADDGAAPQADRVAVLDGALQQVRGAEEARDEARPRALVQLVGRPELLDAAAVHHRDDVRHRHRLLLVVRDMDERDPHVVLDALELELHLLAELQVERAERLVEEQDLGVVDERPRQGDPLLHAAGELPRLPLLGPRQVDETEDLPHAAGDLVAGNVSAAKAEGDVLEDRQVREERVALEDRVHVALVRRQSRDGLVAEVDDAIVRFLEAADHPQRRRLPAAGRPEQGEEGAARDLDRHARPRP